MGADLGHDLINQLPQEIIETILGKLPIIDAVRTCLLSRSWRYRWTAMTHIVFDDRIVTIPRKRLGNVDHEIVRCVHKFLSVHNGPIEKFDLTSHYASSRLHLKVYRWLLSVCRRGVKELCFRLSITPNSPYITVPHFIFSCTKLTSLEFQFCLFEPPPSFTGFSRMKSLVLRHFWTPREDLERFISSCPLLESLTLAYFKHGELTIRALNLKCLNVEGDFVDICLENTPLLVDMTVHARRDNDRRLGSVGHGLKNLLNGALHLERLCGKGYFAHVRADCGAFITYEFLKHIELSSASFDDPREVLVLLRLIFSAPNLQELSVKVVLTSQFMTEAGEFSPDMLVAQGTLDRLKLVKINGEIEKPVCLELIKLFLDRSPSLVRMRIEQHWRRVCPMNRRQMKELSEKVMRL